MDGGHPNPAARPAERPRGEQPLACDDPGPRAGRQQGTTVPGRTGVPTAPSLSRAAPRSDGGGASQEGGKGGRFERLLQQQLGLAAWEAAGVRLGTHEVGSVPTVQAHREQSRQHVYSVDETRLTVRFVILIVYVLDLDCSNLRRFEASNRFRMNP